MNKTKIKAPLDHYQPDIQFKEEWQKEEDKKKYLKGAKGFEKRRKWKGSVNVVAYEE